MKLFASGAFLDKSSPTGIVALSVVFGRNYLDERASIYVLLQPITHKPTVNRREQIKRLKLRCDAA